MKRRAQWPGDAVVKWQTGEDAKVLDERTARVLALGEYVLEELKRKGVSEEFLARAMDDGEDGQGERICLAALAADSAARR